MTDKDDNNFLMGETGISVSFTGVMTGAIFFVIAILMGSYKNNLFSALVYLFISMFGFMYSTIIYANASGHLARLRRLQGEKILSTGNVVSEFFGVYFMVFALPLAFFTFTNSILASIIMIIDMLGFIFYHIGGFSILDRYIKSKFIFYLIVGSIVSLSSVNFITHLFFNEFPYHWTIIVSSIILIAYIFSLSVFCLRKKEN